MEKNILILTTTNEFLGKFERENVRILQRMGYRVHYAANMHEPHYISDQERIGKMGVMVHHIAIVRSPYMVKENRTALRQLLKIIEDHGIQVIHCHTPVGGLLGRLAGKFYRKRRLTVIYTAHGFHFYKGAPAFNWLVYYRVEKKLAHYTDILIVINKEDYEIARKFKLRDSGCLYQIPGVGLDRKRFFPLREKEKILSRQELGIPKDSFFLISIGELNENKNHKIVLDALAKMRGQGKDISRIRYVICGDGFFRERMEEWIKERKLEEIVFLYGHRKKIPRILGCADASVFPSKREGLGMAGLESLSMGVPVIASDNRGTREYMEHKKNGYICKYDDVDGFIKGIEFIQNLSPKKRREMAAYCESCTAPFDQAYANAVMQGIYTGVDMKLEHRLAEEAAPSKIGSV